MSRRLWLINEVAQPCGVPSGPAYEVACIDDVDDNGDDDGDDVDDDDNNSNDGDDVIDDDDFVDFNVLENIANDDEHCEKEEVILIFWW